MGKGGRVLEIGPGLGNLTKYILDNTTLLIGLELDKRLAYILRRELVHSCLEVVVGDFLKSNIKHIEKIISSVPYHIASPLLIKILKNYPGVIAVLILQKELVERIISKPGTKQYGRLSVAVQLSVSEINVIAKHIPKISFIPQPEVDSAAVKIRVKEESPIRNPSFEKFLALIFSQRRRLILKAVKTIYGIQKARLVPSNLANRRVYELSPQEFVELFHAIFKS